MRAAKVQASLRIRAVPPEPSLLAHRSSESRGTFRQKARSLAPLNCWACAVEICHDGMLEDTNSLDGAHFMEMLKPKGRLSRKATNKKIVWPQHKFLAQFSRKVKSKFKYFGTNICLKKVTRHTLIFNQLSCKIKRRFSFNQPTLFSDL